MESEQIIDVQLLNGSLVDVDAFAEYREQDRRFGMRGKNVRLIFPEKYKIRDLKSRHGWQSYSASNTIVLSRHYTWDGPSGPTFDTPSLRLASLVHDIICTETARGYAIKGYVLRHEIYRLIAIDQQCPRWRANGHFAALVGFNWAYPLYKKLRGK